MKTVAIVWCIWIVGSYVPSGQFASYDDCRADALRQFRDMEQRYGGAARPDVWHCQQVELRTDARTLEERELPPVPLAQSVKPRITLPQIPIFAPVFFLSCLTISVAGFAWFLISRRRRLRISRRRRR
jgi:hypothetical protein